MEAPDRGLITLAITQFGQVISDGQQHLFCHRRPMEWALRLDGRRLRAGHAGTADQNPEAVFACQRTDHTLDAGDQAKTLTGEAEAARHKAALAGSGVQTTPRRTVEGSAQVIPADCG